MINRNINKVDIIFSDFVFIYDKLKYIFEKFILFVLEDKVIVLVRLLFKNINLYVLLKIFSFDLFKFNVVENYEDFDVEYKKYDEINKNNDSDVDKIVIIFDILDLFIKFIN